jgi:hypothetical protein
MQKIKLNNGVEIPILGFGRSDVQMAKGKRIR